MTKTQVGPLYMHLVLSYLSVVDVIQGKEGHCVDLGAAQRRDPDALPPGNSFEAIMNILYHAFRGLSQGNQLFAIKAGILTSWHLWLELR